MTDTADALERQQAVVEAARHWTPRPKGMDDG